MSVSTQIGCFECWLNCKKGFLIFICSGTNKSSNNSNIMVSPRTPAVHQNCVQTGFHNLRTNGGNKDISNFFDIFRESLCTDRFDCCNFTSNLVFDLNNWHIPQHNPFNIHREETFQRNLRRAIANNATLTHYIPCHFLVR